MKLLTRGSKTQKPSCSERPKKTIASSHEHEQRKMLRATSVRRSVLQISHRLMERSSQMRVAGCYLCQKKRTALFTSYGPQCIKDICKNGFLMEAVKLLAGSTSTAGIDCSTYLCLLHECSRRRALTEGRLVHAHIAGNGKFWPTIAIWIALLNMYVRCQSLQEARTVFDEMPEPNPVPWTIMIAAYSRHGFFGEALRLFKEMLLLGFPPDRYAYPSVLPACGSLRMVMEVHRRVIVDALDSDQAIGNALVTMYGKCFRMENAWHVFDRMPSRNVITWTAIIGGYVESKQWKKSLELFIEMQTLGCSPNPCTFAAVLPACAGLGVLDEGKQIHAECVKMMCLKQDMLMVESALVDMYAKCGEMKDAATVFENMSEKKLASWTAVISGYARSGNLQEASKLYDSMPTWDVVCSTVMIAGFARRGLVDQAYDVFQKMPKQDSGSWSTMISGFVQNGMNLEALQLFNEMKLSGSVIHPDTFINVLSVCSNMTALQKGEEIHGAIIASGFQNEVSLINALIDMYCKCGVFEKARGLFDKLQQPTTISWTMLISGYGIHGYGQDALKIFHQMLKSGIKPDRVTLVCVLSACCHSGLVDEGKIIFEQMNEWYNLSPSVEHYGCMVGLLGRAGELVQALEFIKRMPIKPDAKVWASLLEACRVYRNVEIGRYAAERLSELDPDSSAPYLLLSNMYASNSLWDEIRKLRNRMKAMNINKEPECSWIEVNKKVHAFVVGDESHPSISDIYAELERLQNQTGCTKNFKFESSDLVTEEKDKLMFYHTEKLAVAFGLISTPPRTTLRIIKNLRVCDDCHSAMKIISYKVGREIIVRDTSCYHHFKGGGCSCSDYW